MSWWRQSTAGLLRKEKVITVSFPKQISTRWYFRANLIREVVPRGAFIFYSLCAFPAFREGNFRTALALTERVLETEGYRITGDKAGINALAEGIRGFITEPEEIEQWLNNNIQKSL